MGSYFFNLYTPIPHAKLKSRLSELIENAFRYKNWKKRNGYIVASYTSTYFVKKTSNANNKYTEHGIIRMFDFSIDTILLNVEASFSNR